jgi:hypothetical protein
MDAPAGYKAKKGAQFKAASTLCQVEYSITTIL